MADIPHPEHEPALGLCVRGVIGRITDGDTIIFMMFGVVPVKVRLLECWSHEISRAKTADERRMGTAAKSYLRARCPEGMPAKLFIPTTEMDEVGDAFSFSRGLGAVYVNGIGSLSHMMVDAGHAFRTKAECDADLRR